MILPIPVGLPEGNNPVLLIRKAGNSISNLYDLLIFSSLLLSFECVAMAYVSCIIQQVQWSMMTAVIPFLVAFSIYNLNQKTDEDEDAINRQDRFAFTKRYEAPLYYGALLALGGALVLSVQYGIPALLATAAPFLLGTLYSFRLLPERCGYTRLKEIPAVKNIVVGLAWATLLSLLPVYLNNGTPDPGTAITFLLFFMWGFMASLIPDVRDREGDAIAGVRTIPVLSGEKRTKTILAGVVFAIGVPSILYSSIFLTPATTMILVAANLYSYACVYLLDRSDMRDFLADAISDGQYICFAGVILTIKGLYPF
jgi:4-hydroxybenzoate polyprenyltransferase